MSTDPRVEKRKPLTRSEVIHLCIRQQGRCNCGCGVVLDPLGEGVVDEHRVALGILGSNDLGNRELWRKPCSASKTKTDLKRIAKAKRLAGETCTALSKRPLRSRGFNKTITRRFDGSVVRRTAK